jgi:hypothetical protein
MKEANGHALSAVGLFACMKVIVIVVVNHTRSRSASCKKKSGLSSMMKLASQFARNYSFVEGI